MVKNIYFEKIIGRKSEDKNIENIENNRKILKITEKESLRIQTLCI
jgi:hypothetical protein